jgi:hypothetical protein
MLIAFVVVITGIPYALINKISLIENCRLINKYSCLLFVDNKTIIDAIIGLLNRINIIKFIFLLPTVVSIVPFIKYVVTINPFTEIHSDYVTQKTCTLHKHNSAIIRTINNIITKNDPEYKTDVYKHDFTAFYQSKKLGIQHGGLLVCFVYPLFNTHQNNIFNVEIGFFNPFHVLCGHVEVNLTHHHLEHPMWCIENNNIILDRIHDLFVSYGGQLTLFINKL